MKCAVTTKPLASCFFFFPSHALMEISATEICGLIGTEMAFKAYLDQMYYVPESRTLLICR